jgi:hypothetical protein
MVVGANNSPAIQYRSNAFTLRARCELLLGRRQVQAHGDRDNDDCETNPDGVHFQSLLDHRSDSELARGTAQHSNALREANCCGQVAR